MTPQLNTVALDLAKNVCHLVGADTTGNMLWRKRLTRHALMPCIAQLPPVLIGREACGGAHDWARRFRAHGHEGKRMAPQFVTPCVTSNKNDRRDAEAIAEAVTRPPMRVVPTKDIDQQDLQALHRVRERLMGERTALIHDVHGLLHDDGLVIPTGVSKCRQAVVEKLASAKDTLTALSPEMCGKLVEACVA
jgi:transposase